VHWLLYVHGADPSESDDLWGALQEIRKTDPPLYDAFMPEGPGPATA